jgi:hypothetical protein
MSYAKKVIDTLCSNYMGGRGYSYNGDWKAAQYLKNEFIALGLKPMFNEYEQQFLLSVNTFPGEIELEIDNKKLKPGEDFLVKPFSGTQKGIYRTIEFKKKYFLKTNRFFKQISKSNCKDRILVIKKDDFTTKEEIEKYNNCIGLIKQFDGFELAAIVEVSSKKLTWHVATNYTGIPFIEVKASSWTEEPGELYINIENKFEEIYTSQNVFGYIEGSHYPDSFIVFSAHYDHLGHMGKETFFPGANDNASGTAMLLNLAKSYSKAQSQPKYSILFIAFGAEEAGLIGSKFYVQHPLFPLNRIKFLMNMDLLGTGEEGMTVVNGSVYTKEFDLLNSINEKKNYLPKIKKRGKAANSDHYYFSENGVPSFFIYTLGGISAYHDIYDIPKTLPLTKYKEVYSLIKDFVGALESKLE